MIIIIIIVIIMIIVIIVITTTTIIITIIITFTILIIIVEKKKLKNKCSEDLDKIMVQLDSDPSSDEEDMEPAEPLSSPKKKAKSHTTLADFGTSRIQLPNYPSPPFCDILSKKYSLIF